MSAEDVAKDPKIEDEDDDEMPDLEPAPTATDEQAGDEGEAGEGKKGSRAENKARKAFSKLGLKPVPGVTRVVVKRGRQIYFVISSPEVMKSATNENTYVFFGEARQEDSSAALQQAAMQFQKQQAAAGASTGDEDDEGPPPLVDAAPAKPSALAATPPAGGPVDESGVNPKHIELVLEQVPSATRGQAVAALKKTNGDIVNAIMELTMG